MIHRIGRVAGAIGWAASAALFGTLLSSIRHVDHVGPVPQVLLFGLAVLTAVRPLDGLAAAAALVPVATFLASRYWNSTVIWPAPIVCAVLAGFSLNSLVAGRGRARTPASLAAPAVCFLTLVGAAVIVSLGVARLRLGPAFGADLVTQLTRDQFVNVRGFLAFHAGLLLLEGVLLFVAAARVSASRAEALPRLASAIEVGALAATVATAWILSDAAAHGSTMWRTFVDFVRGGRWNATFADLNAAGSYYLMAFLAAAGLALAATRRVRAAHAAAALILAAALWLTGSRAALIAGVMVAGVCVGIGVWRTRPAMAVWSAAAAAVVLAAGLGITLLQPERGNQTSSTIAVQLRIGLAQAGARMIASRPVFGIGLAEFNRRSGEFSSPALLEAFPPAVHENAHNNFLQIAAELGLAGGVAFVWLLAAALHRAFRAISSRGAIAALSGAALVAFMLTWLGGHPLLVPEAAVPFWVLLGAAAGAGAGGTADRWTNRRAILTSLAAIAVLALLPFRMDAERKRADMEHVGIGVSEWQFSGEIERYRTGTGTATLFVPAATGFHLKVKAMTDRAIDLELWLDGRLADRIVLQPATWTEIKMPARTRRNPGQFAPLELRVQGPQASAVQIRMTKVEPLTPSS